MIKNEKKADILCDDVGLLLEEIAKGGNDSETLALFKKATGPLFVHISHCSVCLAKAEHLGLSIKVK